MVYRFYGGVHPPQSKILTSHKAIKEGPMPKRVVMPLLQHTGSPAEPVVSVGDDVKVGSLIGRATGFISSSLHASISGRVTQISYLPTPTLGRVLSISIESAGADQRLKMVENNKVDILSKEEMLGIIRDSGIVGLGGAAFPTHVKLSPPKGKNIDSVILNGVECEPYLTSDHRLMLEKPKELIKGLLLIMKILDVKNGFIAIEANKIDAVIAMNNALAIFQDKIKRQGIVLKVVVLGVKYPQGAEKQVIKSVLNRIIPSGGLPMDVGCIVHNVGTAFAVYEAVYFGKPLIERVITITGSCVKEPMNLKVKIGTLLSDIIESFGSFVEEPKRIIVGGPMMGIAQYTMDIPITKGTTGIIFLSKDEIDESKEGACIRCGRCIEICPMGLVPTTLMYNVKKGNFVEAKALGIMNCFECGACAYECPAKIPLLDYMKFGKVKIQGVR
ncbi:MAG: electron transport complex subunit RsxC [Candidatus Omnitrophica bacterium]|nr:electron transport complex subunit RsxC [Candidatus Omnitrophota bacterium]